MLDHLPTLCARVDVLQQPRTRELGAHNARHQAVAHGDHRLRPEQVLWVLLLRLRDIRERLVRDDARDVALVPLEARQWERVVHGTRRLVCAVDLDPLGEAELEKERKKERKENEEKCCLWA